MNITQNIKRKATAGLLAVGVGAAAVVGAGAAAPEAHAAVPSGKYWFDTKTYGFIPTNHDRAVLDGKRIHVDGITVPFHKTARGGWFETSGVRYTFRYVGHGKYKGLVYTFGIVTGDAYLTPRR